MVIERNNRWGAASGVRPSLLLANGIHSLHGWYSAEVPVPHRYSRGTSAFDRCKRSPRLEGALDECSVPNWAYREAKVCTLGREAGS